ncbi:MAG: hypothetical protein WC560_10145 [Syntrophales bacterium]
MTTTEKKERTSKYTQLGIADKFDAISGWIMNGNTDENISEKLGVCYKTLKNWKNDYPEFGKLFQTTKEVRLGELIHSAFKQATGYDYTEDVLTKAEDIKGNPIVVTLRKHQPGNATLVMFMLQNKLPDQYKDRRNIAITDPNDKPLFTGLLEKLRGLDNAPEKS